MYELGVTVTPGNDLNIDITQIWRTPRGHARFESGAGLSEQRHWHNYGSVSVSTHPLRDIQAARHQRNATRALTQLPFIPGPDAILDLLVQHLNDFQPDLSAAHRALLGGVLDCAGDSRHTPVTLGWGPPTTMACDLPDRRQLRAQTTSPHAALLSLAAHSPSLTPDTPPGAYSHDIWETRHECVPTNAPRGRPIRLERWRGGNKYSELLVPQTNPARQQHAAALLEQMNQPELAAQLRRADADADAAYLHLAQQLNFAGTLRRNILILCTN